MWDRSGVRSLLYYFFNRCRWRTNPSCRERRLCRRCTACTFNATVCTKRTFQPQPESVGLVEASDNPPGCNGLQTSTNSRSKSAGHLTRDQQLERTPIPTLAGRRTKVRRPRWLRVRASGPCNTTTQLSSAGSCDVWKHTHKCQTKFKFQRAHGTLWFHRLRAL